MVDFAQTSSVIFTVKLPHCDCLEQMLLVWLCVPSVIPFLLGMRSRVMPGTSRHFKINIVLFPAFDITCIMVYFTICRFSQTASLRLPGTDAINLVVCPVSDTIVAGCEKSCYAWDVKKLSSDGKDGSKACKDM